MNGPAALGANSFLPLLGNWITTVSLPSRFIAARSTLLLSTQIQPIKPLSDIWGEVQLPSVVNSSLWPSENVTRILPVWIIKLSNVEGTATTLALIGFAFCGPVAPNDAATTHKRTATIHCPFSLKFSIRIVDIDSVGQAPGGRIMSETDKMPVHLHRSSKWNDPCLVWTQCHRIGI